jgi:hypothetical protein
MSVAIFSIASTARRDKKQRQHDAQMREEQWERDAGIRIEEIKESQATRQEQRLADAIVSYASALKSQSRVCAMLAANNGLTYFSRETIDPDEAKKLLSLHEGERAIQFERLLLFAGDDLQERARAWQKEVWSATAIQHGLSAMPAAQYAETMTAAGARRAEFYESARKAIGVTGAVHPMPVHDLHTPGVLPAPQG